MTKTRDFIKVPAVTEPHQGTSYNPPADAHRELLLRAATVEKKRLLDLEKMAEVKAKIDAARYTADVGETSFAAGMTVQEIDDHEEEEPVDRSSFKTKVINTKKSRSQRNKEKRLRGEVCSRLSVTSTCLTNYELETSPFRTHPTPPFAGCCW